MGKGEISKRGRGEGNQKTNINSQETRSERKEEWGNESHAKKKGYIIQRPSSSAVEIKKVKIKKQTLAKGGTLITSTSY